MKLESSVEFLFDSYLKELLSVELVLKCMFYKANVMWISFRYITWKIFIVFARWLERMIHNKLLCLLQRWYLLVVRLMVTPRK